MTSLLRTEWLKMRKYRAFWWIISITVISYPVINYMFYNIFLEITRDDAKYGQLVKMALGNPFSFPEAWHTVAYFSSWFIFVPAVVVVMLMSNEYTYRTHRQNIIDGWSRSQFITSKMLDVLIISLIITLLYGTIAFINGTVNQDRLIKHTWDQVHYIGLFALQTFSQLSIAFILAFLIRKAFLVLGIFFFYFLAENLTVMYLRNEVKSPLADYFPFEISDRMIPPPAFLSSFDSEKYRLALAGINKHVLLTLALTTIIWLICYRINNRKDLK